MTVAEAHAQPNKNDKSVDSLMIYSMIHVPKEDAFLKSDNLKSYGALAILAGVNRNKPVASLAN